MGRMSDKTAKPKKPVPSKGVASRGPSGKKASQAGRLLNKQEVEELFRRFKAIDPEPKGELTSVNAFTFLVAVVLSAQATDAGVNKATPALFALADTPQKMLDLGEDKVRDLIKTIGLYRAKAKNVITLSRRLVDVYQGEVPDNHADLETLPGVGRKTANVLLNNAYGVAVIAVDTHVFRVSHRLPLARGKTPLDVELGLEKAVPAAYKQHAHHWLILHGRYTCKARKPACGRCPISDICRWPDKDLCQKT
jgi:endonuclease III